jgi:predicted phosphodiesterase
VDGQYRGRLMSLLEQANVKLVISGHTHHPGDVTTSGGIRMITVPATSFGLPFGEQPQGWLLLTFSRCDGSVKAIEFRKISDPTPPPEKN